MLDMFFRRGNASNNWTRNPGLALAVDLSTQSINSIPIESAVDQFSFLGRSSSKSKSPLNFTDLGIGLDNEDDGTVSGFRIWFNDRDNIFSAYKGTIQLNGTAIEPSSIVNRLGEPYWRDEDEYEIIYFYEFATHEIQVEHSLQGAIQSVIVTNDALMADAEQRKAYGVTKAWPPN